MMVHAVFKRHLSMVATLFLMVSTGADADDVRGSVLKLTGEVHIVDARGERRDVDQAGGVVRETETIVTAEGSAAVVRFSDGALSVIDQSSRLQVGQSGWLSQLGGRIYFTFRKVFGEPRQVGTRFATIGIRGTTFIIFDDERDQGVALAEGLLDIETPGPAFEIHRQRQADEFRAYREQAQEQQRATRRDFADYRERLQREFIEYKKRFSLQASRVVRFDGTRVDESIIDDTIKAEFDNFEAIAGRLLDEFRAQGNPGELEQ